MTFGLKVIKEDAMWLSIDYTKFTQDQDMENDKRERERNIYFKKLKPQFCLHTNL